MLSAKQTKTAYPYKCIPDQRPVGAAEMSYKVIDFQQYKWARINIRAKEIENECEPQRGIMLLRATQTLSLWNLFDSCLGPETKPTRSLPIRLHRIRRISIRKGSNVILRPPLTPKVN